MVAKLDSPVPLSLRIINGRAGSAMIAYSPRPAIQCVDHPCLVPADRVVDHRTDADVGRTTAYRTRRRATSAGSRPAGPSSANPSPSHESAHGAGVRAGPPCKQDLRFKIEKLRVIKSDAMRS